MEVKAGRVQLIWDVVTSEMAGNDDLEAFGVEYDVWGKPYPLDLTSTWRRLYQLPSYEANVLTMVDGCGWNMSFVVVVLSCSSPSFEFNWWMEVYFLETKILIILSWTTWCSAFGNSSEPLFHIAMLTAGSTKKRSCWRVSLRKLDSKNNTTSCRISFVGVCF